MYIYVVYFVKKLYVWTEAQMNNQLKSSIICNIRKIICTETRAISIDEDIVIKTEPFPVNFPLRVNQNQSQTNDRSRLRVFDFWNGSNVPKKIVEFAKELGWDVVHNCSNHNHQHGLECGHLAVEVMHRVGLLVANKQDWFTARFEEDVLNSRDVFLAEQNIIIKRDPRAINKLVKTEDLEKILRRKHPIPELPENPTKWWCDDASGGPDRFLFRWLVDWKKRSKKCVHICLVNTCFESGVHWFVVVFEYSDIDIEQFLARYPNPYEAFHPFYTDGDASIDDLFNRVRSAAALVIDLQ